MTDAAVLAIGDVVADRYRIEAVLGEGGMGIVYRAEHTHLRKPYALKVLLPAVWSMPEVVARFEREAIAAGNIQSPHVAAATDFGRLEDGSFFLVMEYVKGRTLRAVLEAGALQPVRALRILQGIVDGLGAAHARGIIHRDLKPENVMLLERDDDPDFVKVLDFGVAKVDVGRSSAPGIPLTRAGAILGTPEYMSPEQALGEAVDTRSDLYSAGVILFEMLTGKCPFGGGPLSVLRAHIMSEVPELPPAVLESVDDRVSPLLRRLLAKSPDDRYATAAELIAALDESLLAKNPPSEPPEACTSRDSVQAMSPQVAQRVLQSVLAGAGAIQRAARQTLADPSTLVRPGTPRRIAVAAVAIAIGATLLVAMSGAARDRPAPAEAARPSATMSAPSTPPERTAPPTPTDEVVDLPPPPSPPSASASRGAPTPTGSGGSQGRRTGPGGIYIPPPSQWFR
jgi:serine/threonine-protein kinase